MLSVKFFPQSLMFSSCSNASLYISELLLYLYSTSPVLAGNFKLVVLPTAKVFFLGGGQVRSPPAGHYKEHRCKTWALFYTVFLSKCGNFSLPTIKVVAAPFADLGLAHVTPDICNLANTSMSGKVWKVHGCCACVKST